MQFCYKKNTINFNRKTLYFVTKFFIAISPGVEPTNFIRHQFSIHFYNVDTFYFVRNIYHNIFGVNKCRNFLQHNRHPEKCTKKFSLNTMDKINQCDIKQTLNVGWLHKKHEFM